MLAQLWRSYRAVMCAGRKMHVRGVSLDYMDVSCGCRAVFAQVSWDACACAHGHVLHDLEHVSRGFEHTV